MKCANLKSLFVSSQNVMLAKEVALVLRVSESLVYSLIEQNRLPCVRVGRCCRVLKPDLIQCLEHMTEESGQGCNADAKDLPPPLFRKGKPAFMID